MTSELFVFDAPHAVRLTAARWHVLEPVLLHLRDRGSRTALDVGCGVGHFSRFLVASGFRVTGVDVRPENIAEAAARVPEAAFHVLDVEDPVVQNLGGFDVTVCLGLLYHLENPFRAIRNLQAVTRKALLLETMITPERRPVFLLRDEGPGLDQSLRGTALYPSTPAVVALLRRAGFGAVFRLPYPNHEDFRTGIRRRRTRIMLLACDEVLEVPGLRACPDRSGAPDPWITAIARLERRLRGFARMAVRLLPVGARRGAR